MTGNKHKAVIESWMKSIIKDGGVDRLDDLHVDQIDAAWKPQRNWIRAAFESFQTAVEVRNSFGKESDLNVLLSIPLESAAEPSGVTFHCREDLEGSLCYTPPSLYLLRSDSKLIREVNATSENAENSRGNLKLLNSSEFFEEMQLPFNCLYSESKSADDDEYSRYVYFVG